MKRLLIVVCGILLGCEAPQMPRSKSSPITAMLRLDTVPRLEIGSEGDPRFQFDRIVGAGRLENGEILIVDRGSKSLRWYSGSGEFKREAGGTGYGPEDFQDPVAAYVVEGERVFVYDGRLRRLSEWSGNGHVKNSWTMQPTANGHVLNPVGLIGTDFILSAWIVPSESQYVAGVYCEIRCTTTR
jgi:hypothetical protein